MLNELLYRDDLDNTLVRMLSVLPAISGLLLCGFKGLSENSC